MKITKQQLKNIIKDQLSALINEGITEEEFNALKKKYKVISYKIEGTQDDPKIKFYFSVPDEFPVKKNSVGIEYSKRMVYEYFYARNTYNCYKEGTKLGLDDILEDPEAHNSNEINNDLAILSQNVYKTREKHE